MAKRERFDYVLVETTGLADPSSIASTFWVDDGMEIDMTLDAIVTVIDAKHLDRHLSSTDTSETPSSHKVCSSHKFCANAPMPKARCERRVLLEATQTYVRLTCLHRNQGR